MQARSNNSVTSRKRTNPEVDRSPRMGAALSIALHLAVLAALAFWFQQTATVQIVAAGPGEGGEGGGGSIEVGIAEPSAILGFAQPRPVSFIGDQDNPVNNAALQTERPDDNADETLPADKQKLSPDSIKTDRPVASQHEKAFTGREDRGRSASSSALVGRSFGTPAPSVIGGVGIGQGGGFGSGTGLPGGSEYGRRIQAILSRNYNPPAVETGGVQYVIIRLRIARDGKILSIVNGLVSPSYIKQRSQFEMVNYAAQRAVIASSPLPPFPAGFLSGAQEAVAEVWFRYPK
jgi:hypothetical protein